MIERAMAATVEWLAWFLGPIVRTLEWIGRRASGLTGGDDT